MARILADNIKIAASLYALTFCTDFFYRSSYAHDSKIDKSKTHSSASPLETGVDYNMPIVS